MEQQTWDNATGMTTLEAHSTALHKQTYTASTNGTLTDEPYDFTKTSEHNTASEETPTDNSEEKSTVNQEMEALMERFKPFQLHIPSTEERLEMIQEMRDKSLNYLIHMLFGDEDKTLKNIHSIDRVKSTEPLNPQQLSTISGSSTEQTLGTGGKKYSYFYYTEKETTRFESTGTAITANGRKLSFNISLEMSRSFTEMASEQIDFGQPRLCDPLVINLNTNVASVSDQKFFFDIDADGNRDEISMLEKNSGYLALDHNNDGTINDGSELFGTISGNGFKDLLNYDEDGNGWIDEADSIFQKLKIWFMDKDGTSTLITLKEAEVGAIYLGYENTEFSLKNTQNETNAVIQKTGMFLYEDGIAGTIQQMDLAV